VDAADLHRWRRGDTLDDGPAVPLAAEIVLSGSRSSVMSLTCSEGRKHEVKRYCEALGHRVHRLRRIAFGPLTLGALPAGACRALTPREIATLRAAGSTPIMPGTQ
jgi:pseudouridine synthase